MFAQAVSWILVTIFGSCLSSELKVKSRHGTGSNTANQRCRLCITGSDLGRGHTGGLGCRHPGVMSQGWDSRQEVAAKSHVAAKLGDASLALLGSAGLTEAASSAL